MSKKLYFLVLISVLMAVILQFVTLEAYKRSLDRRFEPPEYLAAAPAPVASGGLGAARSESPPPLMAPSVAVQQEIESDRLYGLLSPFLIPAQARPYFIDGIFALFLPASAVLPKLFFIDNLFLIAMILVLLRRLLICFFAKEISPPSGIHPIWNKILWLGFVAWVVGALLMFASGLPMMAAPSFSSEMTPHLMRMEATMLSLMTPYFLLIAGNFLGPVFFVLELWSLFKEGIAPERSA